MNNEPAQREEVAFEESKMEQESRVIEKLSWREITE
jgi:hypothetical protein